MSRETALQALNRLKSGLHNFYKENKFTEHQQAEIDNHYLPDFFGKVSLTDLENVEKKFDIKLPPSYVTFVLEHGLFKIGKHNDEESRLLKPCEFVRLSDALSKEWKVDWEKDFTQEEKKRADNFLCFSIGDEHLQITWYYFFNFNTLNKNTGEVSVMGYCQEDWRYLLSDEWNQKCEERGFDEHLRHLVDYYLDEGVEGYVWANFRFR
jgi:hypothetical protein